MPPLRSTWSSGTPKLGVAQTAARASDVNIVFIRSVSEVLTPRHSLSSGDTQGRRGGQFIETMMALVFRLYGLTQVKPWIKQRYFNGIAPVFVARVEPKIPVPSREVEGAVSFERRRICRSQVTSVKGVYALASRSDLP